MVILVEMLVMKTLQFLIILILLISCAKKNDDPIIVTSLDQITGTWEWESTCGGFAGTCSYPTSTHYADIQFTTNAQFIEMRNDTIYLAAHYVITKSSDSSGTLVLYKMESDAILSQIPISILDNKLVMPTNEAFFSTYKKAK